MAKKVAKKKAAKKVPNPFRVPKVRTARIDMKVTPEEKDRLLAAARKAGKTLTAFIVSCA